MIQLTTKITETKAGQSLCSAMLPPEEEQRLAKAVTDYVAMRLGKSGQAAALVTVRLEVSASILKTIEAPDLFNLPAAAPDRKSGPEA